MIHKLRVSNFYSFLKETEINFAVNKKVPDTEAYVMTSTGSRVTKLMALVGPNASGKTNLLKSIAFMDWFINFSFMDSAQDEVLPFKPFLFHSQNKSSSFLIEFETNNKVYKYEFVITTEKIISEKLVAKTKGKRAKILFSRVWDSKKQMYNLNFEHFKLPAGFSKLVRQNASIISTASQVNHQESLEIFKYFSRISSNLNESGKLSFEAQRDVIEYYNKNPKIKHKAEEILSKYDLGISRIKIDKYEGHEKTPIYRIFGSHKHIDSDKETLLPFIYESAGTKNLLGLLRLVLDVLENGGVALVDEMEHDLHPLMISEIVNLFTSQNYNPTNAQLIFSTHSAQILNKLDKQQIVLVEKNQGISEAWSLADIKGVRADDNFYAKYMSGAYGGVPRL